MVMRGSQVNLQQVVMAFAFGHGTKKVAGEARC